jgi:hypothetical protein
MTFESCLEIIDVHDIRQNGIISFERSKISPAISPKVFHFDEIVWAFKLSTSKVNSETQVFRSAVKKNFSCMIYQKLEYQLIEMMHLLKFE